MEEEKIPKQKPHTSFNRRLPVAKNPEGNMTTAKKNLKILFYRGNMAKGITVIDLKTVVEMNHSRLKIWVNFKQEKECSNLYLKIATN